MLRKELSGDRSSTASRSRSSAATASALSGRTAPARRRCSGPRRETEQHGGERVSPRDARRAPRPAPAARARLAARVRLSGARDLSRRGGAARLERRWRTATTSPRRCAATPRPRRARARRRLRWRERSVRARASASPKDLDRPSTAFSGGELTRVFAARFRFGGRPRSPAPRRADEPSSTSPARVARARAASLDAASILVAHDRWFLEAVTTASLELEAGRSTYFAGPWHAWRREKAARARTRRRRPTASRRHRAARALRRALPLQEEQGQAGAGEADPDRPAPEERAELAASSTPDGAPAPRLRVPQAAAQRPDGRRGRGLELAPGQGRSCTRRSRSSAASTWRSSARTVRQDDAARDARRASRAGSARHGVEPAYFSQHEVELDERGTCLDCARRDRSPAPAGAEPARPLPVLRLGAHEKPVARCPAASGGGSRSRSSSPRAPTSSCSTSRRTTSTSRAARRSRRRSTRSRAPCCSSRTTGAPRRDRRADARRRGRDDPLLRRRLGRLRPATGTSSQRLLRPPGTGSAEAAGQGRSFETRRAERARAARMPRSPPESRRLPSSSNGWRGLGGRRYARRPPGSTRRAAGATGHGGNSCSTRRRPEPYEPKANSSADGNCRRRYLPPSGVPDAQTRYGNPSPRSSRANSYASAGRCRRG
jgi:hypothetical protein